VEAEFALLVDLLRFVPVLIGLVGELGFLVLVTLFAD
jgi:hypothetical protein